MSNAVNLNLCILWEDELRAAARLLHTAHEICEGANTSEEAKDAAASAAYQACMVALWGLRDDHAAVLMASGEIRRFSNPCQESE